MQSSVGFGGDGREIAPGLYLVATPIGAARDITLNALDLLAGVDVLAAEDTRTLRHLMRIHGIDAGGRPLISVHDHNEAQITPKLLALLAEGKSIAYASEAGTPLVSDPGFGLARAAAEAGHEIHAAPGASALLAALMVAGLPTDRFLFAGFPPAADGDRRRFLHELGARQETLILYESPHRVMKTLNEMAEIFGPDRPAALCRELTKRHEEVVRGTLATITDHFAEIPPRGEIVLVIDRTPVRQADPDQIASQLQEALKTMRVRDAASFVAQEAGIPRKIAYQMALGLRKDSPDDNA